METTIKQETTTDQPETTDISPAISDIVGDIPKDFTDEDENATTVSADMPETEKPPVDKYGNTFNPDNHVMENGKPKLSAKGKLCLKPGVRNIAKSGSSHNGKSNIVIPEKQSNDSNNSNGLNPTEQVENIDPEKYKIAGMIAAESMFSAAQMFGGEAWAPKTGKKGEPNEREMVTASFATYFEAKGISDIPPGLALVMSVGSYVGARLVPIIILKMEEAKAEKNLNKNGTV